MKPFLANGVRADPKLPIQTRAHDGRVQNSARVFGERTRTHVCLQATCAPSEDFRADANAVLTDAIRSKRRRRRKDQNMPRKLFSTVASLAILGSCIVPLLASQMPGMPMAPATQLNQSKASLDAQMMSHQEEMQTLLAKLQASFKAIADARDATGYPADKSLLKTHEADIAEFRSAVRSHKLFDVTYEQQCGANGKQKDAMIEHQQQMKGVLYDVVDTFAQYQAADPSSSEISATVGMAFDEHKGALKELADAIAEHKQAMAQMMKKCS